MGQEVKQLQDWLDEVASFSLPSYKELPGIDLYMEQVLSYINGVLSPFESDDPKKGLTSFMVNNYVKAKIITEPIKKKYSKNQIGYLMAITLMKQTMSLDQMKTMLSLDPFVTNDLGRLYDFYRGVQTRVMNERVKLTKRTVDNCVNDFEKVAGSDPKKAEDGLTGRLGLVALRLAAEAEICKLISDKLIETLAQRLENEAKMKKEAKEENSAKRKKEIERSLKKNKGEKQ